MLQQGFYKERELRKLSEAKMQKKAQEQDDDIQKTDCLLRGLKREVDDLYNQWLEMHELDDKVTGKIQTMETDLRAIRNSQAGHAQKLTKIQAKLAKCKKKSKLMENPSSRSP